MNKTVAAAAVAVTLAAGGLVASLATSQGPKQRCTTRSHDGKNTLIDLGELTFSDCVQATRKAP